MTHSSLPPDAAKRLTWPLRLTWLGMAGERAWRAFWPFLTISLAATAALMAGLQIVLTPDWMQGIAAATLALAVAALIRGALKMHLPRRADALARLDDRLPGQPIAALADRQAIGKGDAASEALWQAHQARMAARLDAARAIAPDLRLTTHDPYALRYIALLAFVMAAGFGSLARVTQVGGVLPGASAQAAAGSSWEGWIEPPAYTGKPSLYLNDQPPGSLAVPQGSRLTLRLYGRMGDLTVTEDLSGSAAPAMPEPTLMFDITRNGTLTIDGPGGGAWQITAIGDVPPDIRLNGAMTRTLAGELRQGFLATDDYGVSHGQAEIALDIDRVDRRHGLQAVPEPRPNVVVDLPMPFRGDRTEIEEELFENLAQHPWADLPVTLTLTVSDASAQTGAASPASLTLPGRRFLDPLALALIEQRRDLMWSRENGHRVAQILRAVSHRPDGLFDRETTYLKLRVAIRRLEVGVAHGLGDALRDETAQALWNIAVQIEDGNLADALERLRRAQERVSEAMRQGASPEELAELMDEMRQAMQDYMNQLAQQQPENGENGQAQNQDMQQISPEDLQAMLDKIEELMREGRNDEAQAMLDALQEMMENMQVAEGQQGQGGQSPGEQAMEGLKDTLRQQQGLSDEAFRDLQEQANPSARTGESSDNVGRDGGRGRGQAHSGEGGEGQGEGQGEGAEGDLSDRQRALGQQLDQQRRNLPGVGTEEGDAARDALDRAGRAMDGAAEELENGRNSGALDRQAEAMEALREGMRNLDEAMAQAQRDQQGQQGATAGRSGGTPRDPLGRDPGGSGAVATDSPLADGEDVYRRAQELMQDIRRRSGEGDRPDLELDYLKRLLDRF